MSIIRKTKMLPVYIAVIIFLVTVLWIFGYGAPVTVAVIVTAFIMKKLSMAIMVFAAELELRKWIADNTVEDVRTALKTIKSFDRESYEYYRTKACVENYSEVLTQYFFTKRLRAVTLRVIAGGAVIGDLLIAFTEPAVNVTELIFVSCATVAAIVSLVFCFENHNLTYEEAYSENFMKTMKYGNISNIPANRIGADITLNVVEYRYPDSNENAVNGITLSIYAGERFGIIGRNDSGKTTLVNLIQRKADVTYGTVLINGVVIEELSKAALADIFEKRVKVFDGESAIIGTGDKRTFIIASNRVEDVIRCSRIAVINNGIIEAIGTHEQLLRNNVLYSDLFKTNLTGNIPDITDNEADFSDILEKTE
jgi:ABC-type multidrug transport system fused ATPase/permease subunit